MLKRILLLGATGRTGNLALKYALDKGFQVNALVRRPDAITINSENLSVIQGTPYNPEDLKKAIKECDAIVSILNNNRTSDMPWAKPVSPPDFMSRSITNAVMAMKEENIRRIVILSATGVGDSFPFAPFLIRWMINNTNLGHTYRDHNKQESVLISSDLQWTAVRAVGLSNAKKIKPLIVTYGNKPKPAMMISRQTVAKYMIDCLDDSSVIRKSPVISER